MPAAMASTMRKLCWVYRLGKCSRNSSRCAAPNIPIDASTTRTSTLVSGDSWRVSGNTAGYLARTGSSSPTQISRGSSPYGANPLRSPQTQYLSGSAVKIKLRPL
jgi:hypothetical protein